MMVQLTDFYTDIYIGLDIYNRTLFFIQSQSAQQAAYGLGLRGQYLSSTD